MDRKLHPVVWNDEKVSVFHDNVAELIKNGKKSNNYFSFESGDCLVRKIKKLTKIKNKSVLDYGCGPGHMINKILMNTKAKCVCGFDVSGESVEQANALNKNYSRFFGAYTKIEDVLSVDGGGGGYDIVLLIEVVEHVSDESFSYIFSEIYKLLKPNGIVLITTPNAEVLENSTKVCPDCGCYFHSVQHVRTWTVESLEAKLSKFGFEKKRSVETILLSGKTIFRRIAGSVYVLLSKILKIKQTNLIFIARKK